MTKSPRSDGVAPSLFYPKGSLLCTTSLYFFLSDYRKTLELFFFTVELASRTDANAVIAAKALLHTAEFEKDAAKIEKYKKIIEKNDVGASEKLASYAAINSRHLVTYIVDSFISYLSHLIQATMRKNTNILKSSEKIAVEDLIEFKTRRDVINYIIDRKVNDLTYGGVRKLDEFIRDRLGVQMFEDENTSNLMTIFVELRNINVHNRAYVNDVFLSRVKNHCGFDFEKDKRFSADFDDLTKFCNNCTSVALRLDQLVATKFHLNRKRYATWRKKPPRYV